LSGFFGDSANEVIGHLKTALAAAEGFDREFLDQVVRSTPHESVQQALS
jgi:hypothetical protein